MAIGRMMVLSYHVGVDASSYSHHVDDRLEEFAGRGIRFEVISSICGKRQRRYQHHRILSFFFSDHMREIRAVLKRTDRRSWLKKISLLGLKAALYPLYLLDRNLVPLPAAWSWFFGASLFGLYRCLICRPQVLYAVSGPESVPLTGVAIARCLGIPLVSEFTDPLAQQVSARKKVRRRFAAWAEKITVRNARRVIYVTQTAAHAARQRHPEWAEKITAIYPYPRRMRLPQATENQAVPSPLPWVIAHFGSLYGRRNLHPFVSAVAACRNVDGWEAHLYGRLNSAARNELGLGGAGREVLPVKAFGAVSRAEAAARMSAADVLLLVQHAAPVSAVTIPGKTYEYMQTGKLILSYLWGNPELADLLERHGHLVADMRDQDRCREVTQRMFESWERLSAGVRPLTGDLQKSVDGLLSEMEAVLS